MKYEKFEEWMLGKKVTHVVVESSGVIVERPAEDDPNICVRVEYDEGGLAGDTLGAFLSNLDFLEEKPSEEVGARENSQINWEVRQIDWQVGQEVFCLLRGRGFVVRVGDEDEGTPYTVGVDFGYTFDNYTIDGKIFDDHKGRVLFFSEPIVTAELFPPKKPFIPTLKKGDVVLAKDYQGFRVIRVSSEDEHFVYNEDGTGFGKSGWEFRTLGEEIIFNEELK